MTPRIRFVDGPVERAVLEDRYKQQLSGLSPVERIIWELGFDYGVDDEGRPVEREVQP